MDLNRMIMNTFIRLLWLASFAQALREFNLLKEMASKIKMIPVKGYHDNITAYSFGESQRQYQVPTDIQRAIINDIVSGREFIFVVTLRQENSGQGTIFSILQKNKKRLMDIQSVWKKREVRFNYLISVHKSQIYTEHLPYELSDGQWHQLAISVSGLRLSMYVDCHKVYVRTLPHVLPFSELIEGDTMWLGQRGETKRSSYFVGAMEEIKFVIGSEDAYVHSCKDSLKDTCPSCNQHLHLLSLVYSLQSKMESMTKKLLKAEKSIANLKECECLRKCKVGNRTYNDGDRWGIGKCTECVCKNGKTHCGEKACPLLNCKFPIKIESECCPRCSVSCEFRGVVFEHGEKKVHKSPDRKVCVICTCEHGGMRCRQYRNVSSICPKLNCPISERFSTPDDCCSFCPNTDFCATNPNCHKDADCINLSTKHICKCKVGFRGNGYYCEDIDECKENAKDGNDLCGWNSECINTKGSYECRCKPGYKKDEYNFCVDRDECQEGLHTCHPKAACTNKDGSFSCQCQDGYLGNGYNCTAQCDGQCLHGGICIEPRTCECPNGFRGDRCHIDIDECALGIHKCHINSQCTNTPGSYHCVCKAGFTDFGKSNQFGQLCTDINECHNQRGSLYTCNQEMDCINRIGTYECACKTGKNCNKGCIYEISRRTRRPVRNGVRFYDPLRFCHSCHCKDGKITCRPLKCDCKNRISHKCCPRCQKRRCRYKGITYASGASWTTKCSQCTCQNGVRLCRPLLCPSMASCSRVIELQGHCCPICASDNPCSLPLTINPLSLGGPGYCDHKGRRLKHAEVWTLSDNLCITCQCKFGHICCSHGGKCRSTVSNVT